MPETITIAYNGSITIPNGPKVAFSQPLKVDAYQNAQIPVATRTKQEVKLAAEAADLRLLVVTSSKYHETDLTFTIGAAAASHPLNMPVLLGGSAALSVLGNATSLTFTNELADAVTLGVFFALDTTPAAVALPPPPAPPAPPAAGAVAPDDAPAGRTRRR